MPLQSVELVLDAATDEAVRGLWQALSDAGLPSQADHHGPSNAPHVTLAALPVVTDAAEEALVPLAARLPLRLELGTAVLLGERRPALVLPVRQGGELDRLHADVAAAFALDRAGTVDGSGTADGSGAADGVALVPGGGPAELPWVPHVTLARRVPDDLAPRALALARSLGVPAPATATGLRRWDPERRQAWLVG